MSVPGLSSGPSSARGVKVDAVAVDVLESLRSNMALSSCASGEKMVGSDGSLSDEPTTAAAGNLVNGRNPADGKPPGPGVSQSCGVSYTLDGDERPL